MNRRPPHPVRLLLPVLLALVASPAWALRCNGRIVDNGDRVNQVQRWCGEPYYVDRYSDWLVTGENRRHEERIERRIEDWYYNFGDSRLLRRLRFVDDVLVGTDELGHGFDRIGTHCDRRLLVDGMPIGELIARCGAPESTTVRYREVIDRRNGVARARDVRDETWIYTLDGNTYELTLLDGVLVGTERQRQ